MTQCKGFESVAPCFKPAFAGGLCATCYQRKRRRKAGIGKAQSFLMPEKFQVTVESSLADSIKRLARREGLSTSAVIRQILETHFRF